MSPPRSSQCGRAGRPSFIDLVEGAPGTFAVLCNCFETALGGTVSLSAETARMHSWRTSPVSLFYFFPARLGISISGQLYTRHRGVVRPDPGRGVVSQPRSWPASSVRAPVPLMDDAVQRRHSTGSAILSSFLSCPPARNRYVSPLPRRTFIESQRCCGVLAVQVYLSRQQ